MLDQQVETIEVGSEAYWRNLAGEENSQHVISGLPYSRFSADGSVEIFFDDCEPVDRALAKIVRVCRYEISPTTHKHVDERFRGFLKVTCEIGDETLFFHADDLRVV